VQKPRLLSKEHQDNLNSKISSDNRRKGQEQSEPVYAVTEVEKRMENLSLEDIVKLDDKFQRQIRAHPEDGETLIHGHLLMVLVLPNHPICKDTKFMEWIEEWSVPYSRVEQLTPKMLSDIAVSIRSMIQKLVTACCVHYSFLQQTTENLAFILDSVSQVVWHFVYDDFFFFC
jgi:hypothetical protein